MQTSFTVTLLHNKKSSTQETSTCSNFLNTSNARSSREDTASENFFTRERARQELIVAFVRVEGEALYRFLCLTTLI